MARIGCVFNPRSGRSNARALFREVTDSIATAGHTIDLIQPVSLERIEHLVRQRVNRIDALLVIGGDGTLNATVNGLLNSDRPDLPVGTLPAGRGKDTARTLPAFSTKALKSIGEALLDPIPIDIGIVEDATETRYFINIAEVGVGAEAARVATILPRQFGAASYTLGAAWGLLSVKPVPLTLRTDSISHDIEDALAVIVCNGKSFGGGLIISPMADPLDGVLDIAVIRRASLLDLGLNLGRLKRGTLIEHPALERWRASEIILSGNPLGPVEADGEMLPMTLPRFTIRPRLLHWMHPQ